MADSSSRRGILIGLGALAIVAGLVAAVAMWNIGGDRRADAVEQFARAPVGCDTTLDFVETGEYFVYVESAGRLDEIRGDCDIEGAYDVGSGTPDVEVTIVDPDGETVDVDRAVTDIDYAENGFVGSARFTVDIEETDDHVIRVESSDDEAFAVAIGRDPSDGVALLRGGGVAVGLLGVLLGAGLIALGARRARAEVAAPQWAPGVAAPPSSFAPGQAPQGPPVFGQQAGPPQYPRPPQPQPSGQPQPGPPPQPYGQPQPGPPPQPTAPPGPPSAPPGQAPPPQHPPQLQPPVYQQPPVSGGATVHSPPQPQIPGEPMWGAVPPPPTAPAVPQNPASSAQPIDWSPQPGDDTAVPADTAPPDEDSSAQLRDERERNVAPTDERPPPAPPN